jgi:hypothetical protein
LTQSYPNLINLTLRQCGLSDTQLTKIINSCHNIKYLDISDNPITGKSLEYLGPNIEALICGDLATDELIETFLMHITNGNGIHVKKLSIFGELSSLKLLKRFKNLEKLELHFFSDEELIDYLSVIGFLSLEELVLEQIRCFDHMSAIDDNQFVLMLKKSCYLKKLVISGEYGWHSRLSNDSLQMLPKLCPILESLTLTGNQIKRH